MDVEQLKSNIATDPNYYIGGFDWCEYHGGWRSRCHLDGTRDSHNQWVSFIYHGKRSAIDHARGESVGLLDLYCNINGLSVDEVLKQQQEPTTAPRTAPIAPRPTPQPQQAYYTNQEQARQECKQNRAVTTPLHTWLIDLCTQADTARRRAMHSPQHYTERAEQALHRYAVGGYCNLHQQSYTCFWYVDSQSTIQAKKQVIYNLNGKRDRTNPYSIVMRGRPMCFFGEHLLRGNSTAVVIVESEKTAVLCSILIDSVVWLATGGSGNLDKLLSRDCLHGRTVYVCADSDKVTEWRDIATKHRETHGGILLLNDMQLKNDLLNLNGKEDIGDKAVNYLIKTGEVQASGAIQALIDKNPLILDFIREFELVIDENPPTAKHTLKAVETRPQYARR